MLNTQVTVASQMLAAGRRADAETLLRRVLRDAPRNANVLALLAKCVSDAGKQTDAIDFMRRAVAIEPHNPIYLVDLGISLMNAKRLGQADKCFQKSLRIAPTQPEPHCGMGKLHASRGEFEQAAEYFQTAIAMHPMYAHAHYVLAIVRMEQRRHAEAIAGFRRVIALVPTHQDAHFALATSLLATGQFAEGWTHWEHRKKLELPRPWRGEDVRGRTVLLHADRGFGDTLQFVRYAPMVAARGARVLLCVQPVLRRLLAAIPGVAEVLPPGTPISYDVQAPMMSLPGIFGTRLETIPNRVPYLSGDASAWRDVLDAMPGLKVGVVWAGAKRPDVGAAAADGRRSMPLRTLAPLLSVPGCSFVSLQLGPPAQQLSDIQPGLIRDVADRLKDWQDTADLVAGLDLVVTVDTSVAHLAGAMGKPVWMLNRFDSCWRWLIGRADSPWYPSMKIFRQEQPGDWAPVVAAVARDLATIAV